MKLRPLVVAFPLLLASACDEPRTDEEIGSIADEKAAAKVAPLEERVAEAEKKLEGPFEDSRVVALQAQFADLSAQTVALEAQLAEAQGRLDALEKANEKPAAPVHPGRPDPAATYKVTIGDAQALGPADALVTIVTWSDFQCPYCKRVGPTIDQLRKDYGSDLRYVFKHNPLSFHTNARSAAIAAEAAGEQGKFWEMHDLLFENGRDLNETNYIKWARKIGLNIKQFKKDMADPAIAARIERQQSQGNDLGARGTPAFFINGRFLSGAQPVASFKVLIDEEMGKAKAKVAAGTPRSGVYEATIAGGKTEP